eukprot:3966955-Amphidinium_carterae.1
MRVQLQTNDGTLEVIDIQQMALKRARCRKYDILSSTSKAMVQWSFQGESEYTESTATPAALTKSSSSGSLASNVSGFTMPKQLKKAGSVSSIVKGSFDSGADWRIKAPALCLVSPRIPSTATNKSDVSHQILLALCRLCCCNAQRFIWLCAIRGQEFKVASPST